VETFALAERVRPDLIITDMGKGGSEMDGEQTARAIKSIPAMADVPILLISGVCETNWDRELFCDFVPLPIGPDQLIPCVRRWLGE